MSNPAIEVKPGETVKALNGMSITMRAEKKQKPEPAVKAAVAINPNIPWTQLVQQRTKELSAQAANAAKAEHFADLLELLQGERAILADAEETQKKVSGAMKELAAEVVRDSKAKIVEYERLQKEALAESSGIKLEALKVIAKRSTASERTAEVRAYVIENSRSAWAWLAAFAEKRVPEGILKHSDQSAVTVNNVGYVAAFPHAEELVAAMTECVERIKATGQERRQAYESEVEVFLIHPDEVKRIRSNSDMTMERFRAMAKGPAVYVLRVPYEKNGRKKFGDVLLEKETSGRTVAVKATQADLAHDLFRRGRGEDQTFSRRYVDFDEKSNGYVERLLVAAKMAAIKYEKSREEDRAEIERLKDVSKIDDLITDAELAAGQAGTVPYHVRKWVIRDSHGGEQTVSLTFHVKAWDAAGTMMVKVADATSKTIDNANFLQGYAVEKGVYLQNFLADPRMGAIRGQNQFWETEWAIERYCQKEKIAMDQSSVVDLLDSANPEISSVKVGICMAWFQKRGRDESRPFKVGVAMERTGETMKVLHAVPGFSAHFLGEYVGKSYKTTDLPKRLRTFLGVVSKKITGFDPKNEEALSYLLPPSTSAPEHEEIEEPATETAGA